MAGDKPEYWDPTDVAHKEKLRREIERALEDVSFAAEHEVVPPWDPLNEWWSGLPDVKRRELGVRAEEYSSAQDFFYRYVAPDIPFGPFGLGAREWIHRNLDDLFSDAERMKSDPAYARGRIERFSRIARGYLSLTFGIEAAHRPVQNADRDRKWSQQQYLGRTYRQIADRYSEETGEAVAESDLSKAVARHRKRRQALTRSIAHAIWDTESR